MSFNQNEINGPTHHQHHQGGLDGTTTGGYAGRDHTLTGGQQGLSGRDAGFGGANTDSLGNNKYENQALNSTGREQGLSGRDAGLGGAGVDSLGDRKYDNQSLNSGTGGHVPSSTTGTNTNAGFGSSSGPSGGDYDNGLSGNTAGNNTTGNRQHHVGLDNHHAAGGAAHVPGTNKAVGASGGVGGATGTHAHAGTEHDPHGHGASGSTASSGTKPSVGDKISGTAEVLIGKATHNPAKIQEGEVKKTEGKAAAAAVKEAGINGTQGGSVARALLSSPEHYRIVGFTRDASSDVSQLWAKQGVEMRHVEVFPEKKAEVFKAFEGASYVFAVSVSTAMAGPADIENGKLMVEAAVAAGTVKLFIWSGLDSTKTISGGQYGTADPFHSKEVVGEYLKASGLPWSIVQCGRYASIFIGNGHLVPKRQPDETYLIKVPCPADTTVYIVDAANQYGLYVRAAVECPSLGPSSELLTGAPITLAELAATLERATGKVVRFEAVDAETWMKTGPYARNMYESFMCCYEFGQYGAKDVEASQDVAGIKSKSFEEIVAEWDGALLC